MGTDGELHHFEALLDLGHWSAENRAECTDLEHPATLIYGALHLRGLLS